MTVLYLKRGKDKILKITSIFKYLSAKYDSIWWAVFCSRYWISFFKNILYGGRMQLYKDFTELRVHVLGSAAVAQPCSSSVLLEIVSRACLETSVGDPVHGSYKSGPEFLLKISMLITSHQELHSSSQGKRKMRRNKMKTNRSWAERCRSVPIQPCWKSGPNGFISLSYFTPE